MSKARMTICRVYLKGGEVIELRGHGFVVTHGSLEGDIRSIGWDELDTQHAEPLWLDMGSVAAVVVSDA